MVAACLTGAVVVVVGYASGVGLKTASAGADTTVAANGGQPAMPQVPPAQQPIPSGQLPPPDAVQPLPSVPGLVAPPIAVPAIAAPVADVPQSPQPPLGTPPVSPGPAKPGEPPPSPGTPDPPGTPVPDCQPGVLQPVVDAATGLPLVGGLTTGLGLTGQGGILTTLVGSCQPQLGLPPLPVPVGAALVQATPAGGG